MGNDIEETLLLLERAEARFLVVGGVAVVLHGYLRLTADLDLVVSLEPENLRKALTALEADGFHPRAPVRIADFADKALRRSWIEEKNLQVFSLWNPKRPAFEVDIFVEPPFDFESAWLRAIAVEIGDRSIRIVSISDLIAMKQDAGRPRDLEDIEALQQLRVEDGASGK